MSVAHRLLLTASVCALAAQAAMAGSSASSAASSGAIDTFLGGGMSGKIVWVEKAGTTSATREMFWMDLDNPGSGSLITGASNAHSPLISPDGTEVVYSKITSGGVSTGVAEIRTINGGASQTPVAAAWAVGIFDPHWYDDGSSEYIVYSTCSPSIADSNGYQTKKYDVSDDTVTTLWATRGMDAGLTGDGRFLGEAYDYNFTVDFNSGAGVLDAWSWYAHSPDTRTCNGSMSPDSGRNWRMLTLMIPHEFIRVYRYSPSKVRWEVTHKFGMPDPVNQNEWQHPEWSNHPDFAIATAGKWYKPYDIYLVNTTTGASLKVLDYPGDTEPDPTAEHPCLHIDKPASYILFQPAELVLTALVDEVGPLTGEIVVSNWGTGGVLTLGTPTVVSGSWITSVSESSGTITVTVDPSAEIVGEYTGVIQITSGGAVNSPRQATVTLHVLASDADEDGDGSSNEAEAANGTDPLDEYSYYVAPSDDSSSSGCMAGVGGSGAALLLALLGAALAAKGRA